MDWDLAGYAENAGSTLNRALPMGIYSHASKGSVACRGGRARSKFDKIVVAAPTSRCCRPTSLNVQGGPVGSESRPMGTSRTPLGHAHVRIWAQTVSVSLTLSLPRNSVETTVGCIS